MQSDRQTQTEPGVREMFTCDNVLPQGVHAEEVDGLQHSLQSQQQVGPVGQVDKPLHAFPRVVGRPGLHHPAQQNPGHVVGSPEDPPTAVQRLAGALWDMEMVVTDAGSCSNSKHWFTTSFLQPLPYLVTPYGPENCQLTSSFFVGAQTVVSLLQTTQIKQALSFIAANKVYTSTNKTTIA